jgi:hypothetical protein
MTNNDSVEAVIQQFLRHLEGEGEIPSLDHLNSDERNLAEELMDSLQAARGMDPEASRPSLERLLVDTKHFGHIQPTRDVRAATTRLDVNEVRERLTSLSRGPVRVEVDVLAESAGVRSNYVIFVAGHRLRMQVRDELPGSEALRSPDTIVTASPVFGRFHDTAGVVVSIPDDELSSVVVDPFDSEYCIETPTGRLRGPRVPRPVLPLADAIRSFLEEIAPIFEAIPTFQAFDSTRGLGFDAQALARHAVEAVAENGRRARISAKRESWSTFGDRESKAIKNMILDASRGKIDAGSLERRLTELARTSS